MVCFALEQRKPIEILIGRGYLESDNKEKLKYSVFTLCLKENERHTIYMPDGHYIEHCKLAGEHFGGILACETKRDYDLTNGLCLLLTGKYIDEKAKCNEMPPDGIEIFERSLKTKLM